MQADIGQLGERTKKRRYWKGDRKSEAVHAPAGVEVEDSELVALALVLGFFALGGALPSLSGRDRLDEVEPEGLMDSGCWELEGNGVASMC